MKKLVLACCMSLMVPFFAGAAVKSKNLAAKKAILKALVKDFYADKAVKEFNAQLLGSNALNSNTLRMRHGICEEDPSVSSCINAICAKLSKYDCDDVSELKEVAATCANNLDGSCVDVTCAKLSKYDCDDMSELKEVAKSCSGHVSGACVEAVCSKVSKYDCDDVSELKGINQTCSGLVDSSCINAICSKLSKYDCDDVSELKEIILTCKGD